MITIASIARAVFTFGAASFLLPAYSVASPSLPNGNFQTSAPTAQAIEIERTIGDDRPDKILVCIDGLKVGALREGERIRIFLTATRAHDVYLVTRGMATCDVNQVVTVVEIPTETPIWQVGIERDDSIKLLRGVSR